MKKILLASTALVLSAGVAAAEVKVGGDGRMGIIDTFGDGDIAFTSRIRISFAASGQTDGGLTFGGSIRADNAVGGVGVMPNGQVSGSVFISGAFGRLTMGDVSGAAEAAVGDVSGVGLTGLGDLNEATYLSNSARGRSAMRYDYTTGAFGIHLSADNPNDLIIPPLTARVIDDAYSVALTYNGGAFKAGLGYENASVGGVSTDHIVVGGSATFAGATLKAFYGTADGGIDGEQYGLSIDYAIDALTLTAFYVDKDTTALGSTGYGLGAAYDLGGGATLKGGYARNDTTSEDAFDFGIALTF
jgi:outer membrane protein OmpU